MSAGTFDPVTDGTPPMGRACEWCGSPMDHDGRAVCPSCGRLASRLAVMDEDEPTEASAPPAPAAPPPPPPRAATPPPVAPTPPAPRPPEARPPAPTPPAASTPHAPSMPGADPVGSGPVAPGGRWPTPAPLPPEEDPGRPWWKIAIPVAAVLLVIGVAAAVFLGGGSRGSGDSSASAPAPTAAKGTGKVDLSDVDDPAVTTTRPPTSSTTTTTEASVVTTPDGRIELESDSGITWSMSSQPAVRDVTSGSSSDPVGQTWSTTRNGTTETVTITEIGDEPFSADAAIDAISKQYDGTLAPIEESHIEDAPGQTSSFSGTMKGDPVVGYVVAAQVGDESLVISMVRKGQNLDGLYSDWLGLPSTVKLP